jgi:hypothetical protein
LGIRSGHPCGIRTRLKRFTAVLNLFWLKYSSYRCFQRDKALLQSQNVAICCPNTYSLVNKDSWHQALLLES